MTNLLDKIRETYVGVNKLGGVANQVTLIGDKLSELEFKSAISWLLGAGAKWSEDADHYKEMGYKNTYHFWLGIPSVKMHCGFVFKGKTDDKNAPYALQIKSIPESMNNLIKNIEFRIAFVDTNIRWLLGENPVNEELIARHRADIKDLQSELDNLRSLC